MKDDFCGLTSVLVALFVAVVLALMMLPEARGDVVVTKSGDTYEGSVIDLGKTLQIKLADTGRYRTVKKSDLQRWETGEEEEEEEEEEFDYDAEPDSDANGSADSPAELANKTKLTVEEQDTINERVRTLLFTLNSKNKAKRKEAATQLREIGEPGAKEIITQLQFASDTATEILVSILCEIGTPPAVKAATKVLLNHPNARVQLAAAKGLEPVWTKEVQAALLLTMMNQEEVVSLRSGEHIRGTVRRSESTWEIISDDGGIREVARSTVLDVKKAVAVTVRAFIAKKQGRADNAFAAAFLWKIIEDDPSSTMKIAANYGMSRISHYAVMPYAVDLAESKDPQKSAWGRRMALELSDPVAHYPAYNFFWSPIQGKSELGKEMLSMMRTKMPIGMAFYDMKFLRTPDEKAAAYNKLVKLSGMNFLTEYNAWQKWYRKNAPARVYLYPYGKVSRKLVGYAGGILRKNVEFDYRVPKMYEEITESYRLPGSQDTCSAAAFLVRMRNNTRGLMETCRIIGFVNAKLAGSGFHPFTNAGTFGGVQLVSVKDVAPPIDENENDEQKEQRRKLERERVAKLLLHVFARSFFLDHCLENQHDCPASHVSSIEELDNCKLKYCPKCARYLKAVARLERALAMGDLEYAIKDISSLGKRYAALPIGEQVAFAAERGFAFRDAIRCWNVAANSTDDQNLEDLLHLRKTILEQMRDRHNVRVARWKERDIEEE